MLSKLFVVLAFVAIAQANTAVKTCHRPIDITFVVDASGSIDMNEWKTELTAVKRVAAGLPKGSRGSATQFSSVPQTSSEIDWTPVGQGSGGVFDAKIDAIKKKGGATYLERAVQFALAHHGKKGASTNPFVFFILTDGFIADVDKIKDEVKEMQKLGLVIAVGIGKNFNAKQLEAIASKGHVYQSDFAGLPELGTKLSQVACAAAPTKKPTKKPVQDQCCDRVFAVCRNKKSKKCNRGALARCVRNLKCVLGQRVCNSIKTPKCKSVKVCNGQESKDGKSEICNVVLKCTKKQKKLIESKRKHCKLAQQHCGKKVCKKVCTKICKLPPRPTTQKPATDKPLYKRAEVQKAENLCKEKCRLVCSSKAVVKAAEAKKVETAQVSQTKAQSVYEEASL
jgi:hypothetical protein